jgi:hypothetical protein
MGKMISQRLNDIVLIELLQKFEGDFLVIQPRERGCWHDEGVVAQNGHFPALHDAVKRLGGL